MEEILSQFMQGQPLSILFLIIALFIFTLVKGAELLVDEAVALSLRWGIPTVLIGATIVSLGTTLPEAAVSVLAAVAGKPSLALGNAVGSIICDTGLILGIAAVMAPLPLNRAIVNRQGWIQLGAGFLLVIACLPWSNLGEVFTQGGRLHQTVGILFLFLLAAYLYLSVRWVKTGGSDDDSLILHAKKEEGVAILVLLKLIFAIVLVVLSSQVIIPAVEETARRLSIPNSIIAATLVAFGTSLPELVTAITAVRKGHGGLAVGNVIGADILNVLFVAGAAAAVTGEGLMATPHFFRFLFPAMILVLVIFRIGIFLSKDKLGRPFGLLLLFIYFSVTVISLTIGSAGD